MTQLGIEFVVEDSEGEAITYKLPAMYEVCRRCKGHGTHLNPSIGEHGYTKEEFEEAFDEEQRVEYCKRGGIYDVPCETCQGLRVVAVVDRAACQSDELKRLLAAYDKAEREEREYEQMAASEHRMQMAMAGEW